MVVFRVSVELKNSDFLHWELGSWPDLGGVERVEADLGCLLGSHDLDFHGPFDVTTLVDGLVELSLRVVWVETLSSKGFVKVELFRLE